MSAHNPEGTAQEITTDSAPSGNTQGLSRGNLAPAAAVAFVFVILRIFAVSGYDWTISFKIWWLPAATAAVFGVFALTRLLPVKHWLRRMFAVAMTGVGGVAAVAILLVAAFVQTPWVPHEQIVTAHGPISGYVLSVDPGYLNVLTDEHEFLILNSSDVLSRK